MAARHSSQPPVVEPSTPARDTPASARAAAVIATRPPAAAAMASPRSRSGRPGRRPPNTSRPVAAAPTSRVSPQYQAQRPATASRLRAATLRTSATAWDGGSAGAPAAPTPNPKTPSVRCPSTAETIRQVTV
jgi:hypothetical protein